MNNFSRNLRASAAAKSIELLSRSDKKRLLIVVVFQILLGLLDLIGILLIGVLGALTVNGIQSKTPGTRVSNFLKILNVENLNFQMQVQ